MVTVGFVLSAVSKIPSLLKSHWNITPRFRGWSVAVNVTSTLFPPMHCWLTTLAVSVAVVFGRALGAATPIKKRPKIAAPMNLLRLLFIFPFACVFVVTRLGRAWDQLCEREATRGNPGKVNRL